ncbi:MAG TPA: DNA polymerase/3'-5' exonuclease PolX [Solirubrobacteraceae bacterium]|nr:DNA polymerase/3'-5' exonuclease PolX [Solirubrobacteraceae bacterium]
MPELTNTQIAAALDELGDLYELDGAIVHRIVAYRTAAKAVRESSVSVGALARQGRATALPGIGKTLQEKIVTLLETGDTPSAQRMRAKFPSGLIEMTRAVPGLGPKRARILYDELGIDSIDALREAAANQRIRGVRGFGAKAEENILASLAAFDAGAVPGLRLLLPKALDAGDAIVEALRAHPGSDRVELAGSARRLADAVKDLDVIATAHEPMALAEALSRLDIIESAGRATDAGTRGRTHTGLPVDLKIVAPDQFGNLLQHFTGSKQHNMALREAAVRRGLHVSEYGILDDATGDTLRCATEEEVYERLGYQWIPPELREGRGELEAAARGDLPELVTEADLRGELHAHTTASDGTATLQELAFAARERGLEYLAITDHSATHGFGNEVSPERLREQIERVHALNEKLDGIELLAGSEVNILPDGAPDYDDDLLAQLDWVIGSVHTAFRMGEPAMTERMVAAIEHPLIDAIGHPTGRKIEQRAPYPVDMERVIEAAARTGTMLEINSSPDRRDLDDVHARAAAQAGVRVLVDTDAHSIDNLGFRRWGIATARRAWLTCDQVANTRPWPELAALRKRALV